MTAGSYSNDIDYIKRQMHLAKERVEELYRKDAARKPFWMDTDNQISVAVVTAIAGVLYFLPWLLPLVALAFGCWWVVEGFKEDREWQAESTLTIFEAEQRLEGYRAQKQDWQYNRTREALDNKE